jgi:hypothetical protein
MNKSPPMLLLPEPQFGYALLLIGLPSAQILQNAMLGEHGQLIVNYKNKIKKMNSLFFKLSTINKKRLLVKILIEQYKKDIESEIKSWECILSDNSWASSKSDYHKKCRTDAKELINNLKKQIKFLK